MPTHLVLFLLPLMMPHSNRNYNLEGSVTSRISSSKPTSNPHFNQLGGSSLSERTNKDVRGTACWWLTSVRTTDVGLLDTPGYRGKATNRIWNMVGALGSQQKHCNCGCTGPGLVCRWRVGLNQCFYSCGARTGNTSQ